MPWSYGIFQYITASWKSSASKVHPQKIGPQICPSFASPQQTAGSTTTPKTPKSSSRKPQKGTNGSTSSSRQEEDSAMPEGFTPEPTQATGGHSNSEPRSYSQAAGSNHTHRPQAKAPLPLRQCPSMCTRAQHRRTNSLSKNSIRDGRWCPPCYAQQ